MSIVRLLSLIKKILEEPGFNGMAGFGWETQHRYRTLVLVMTIAFVNYCWCHGGKIVDQRIGFQCRRQEEEFGPVRLFLLFSQIIPHQDQQEIRVEIALVNLVYQNMGDSLHSGFAVDEAPQENAGSDKLDSTALSPRRRRLEPNRVSDRTILAILIIVAAIFATALKALVGDPLREALGSNPARLGDEDTRSGGLPRYQGVFQDILGDLGRLSRSRSGLDQDNGAPLKRFSEPFA